MSLLSKIIEMSNRDTDRVYLQPGLKESFFNLLCSKQIDHIHMYFKKSHNSLKILYD